MSRVKQMSGFEHTKIQMSQSTYMFYIDISKEDILIHPGKVGE